MEFTRNLLTRRSMKSPSRILPPSPRLPPFRPRYLSQYTASQLRSSLRTPLVTPPHPYVALRSFASTTLRSTKIWGPREPIRAPDQKKELRQDVPSYEITFTCKPCLTRATHRISKQGYHKGTILITCPNCKARHLISDHLKVGIFKY